MEGFITWLLLCFSLLHDTAISITIETISTSQSLTDADIMLSPSGTFALGFFSSPENSKNRYLGIWYNRVSTTTVVWVANRNKPLYHSSGELKIAQDGILELYNSSTIVWSSSSSRFSQKPVIAVLLDSGNFIVKEAVRNNDDSTSFLWQSFDYPGDTLLPGMKLGIDLTTGMNRYLTSWTSHDDPSSGNYTFQLDITGYPRLCIRNGESKEHCSGSWNGVRFSGVPLLKQNSIFNYYFVSNQEEIYYTFELVNSSVYSRFSLTVDGIMTRYVWNAKNQSWSIYLAVPKDLCDYYGKCGVYGSCNIDSSPACGCLKGFEPKVPEEWNQADWSSGCNRNNSLSCRGDGFAKFSSLKLPDTERTSWLNKTLSLEECAEICIRNCSCTAYAALDIRKEASGCLLWYGDLIDIRVLNDPQQDIYVRMSKKDLDEDENLKHKSDIRKLQIIVSSSVISVGILILCLSFTLYRCKKYKINYRSMRGKPETDAHAIQEHQKEEELDLPLFDLATLISATNNFSINNILGKGGFGTVYQGMLEDGREIAVKRLSENTRQGLQEFKSEVMHVVKLQHRNLVKLLGCCIEADERMLVYEFMPNKSLDYFIFDNERSILLDWPQRFLIIIGIARGLLYLHQDSRHRIIHRDLKAGNILLDNEMNAKISDFGLARSFAGNENEASTVTIVGTYGYLSPEYLIDGIFSTKSDVYSFGVLLLEIVSGKRNRGFSNKNHRFNLLGHVWTFFMEGNCIEIVDTSIRNAANLSEVMRAIHVGLLCVQQSPEDRPSMSYVLMMLSSEWILPQPKMPGFFTERDLVGGSTTSSINGLTITQMGMNMSIMMKSFFTLLLFGFFSVLNNMVASTASDTIDTLQSISDNKGDTMVSADETFALGFFSPTNSKNRYIGIWYNKVPIQTVVWVANKDNPLTDSSGVLKVNATGILLLLNGKKEVIWSSNTTGPAKDPVSGVAQLTENPIFIYEFSYNEEEAYFIYELINSSVLHRLRLSPDGFSHRTTWSYEKMEWVTFFHIPADSCDYYAKCGGYASCNVNKSPICNCLDKFVQNGTKCVRRTSLNCHEDGFLKYSGLKLPDTDKSWFDRTISLEECRVLCLKNCSCTAYAPLDISSGARGCLLWFDDLMDMKELNSSLQDVYIRMAKTELGNMRRNQETKASVTNDDQHEEDIDLPLFDISTIASATNNFSSDNILGQGGFGLVYKGILEDGREIAVKRRSQNSTQGLKEFKNEVKHVSKLQHRNLVKLLGCCIQATERLLIYEFMPNKSLDFFIFDEQKAMLLGWPTRLHIINGIARGLLYLRQDSRHRIVHRDLKAANVLLDAEMNPKVSDFGLARSFGGNEVEASTQNVVGTYGYLSPEYVIDGVYSTKSDVFSFGVLVLEIVSGKRNRGFNHQDHHFNLLGHAWRLFTEGKGYEIVCNAIRDTSNLSSVLRLIHIGLLCVQQNPDDRPSMSSVVLMLSSEIALPQPKMPGFFTEREMGGDVSSSSSYKAVSNNDYTVSLLEAR
ncbi:hypothetical protein Ahy_A08g040123 isoform B [Arachis hypogaea]|uniref:non-specific serine/threonine protein kinase n=1 Tax=Arachis hypogaea TaxID=3818 RepID=A0A445BZ05_ARAHY|nr:hypothetical protein Ahy_A08g040123 isoform B [Arachis hypogaea]